MEFVRISRNAWGQSELLGASWEPLWLFVAAGLAAIVVHALFVAVASRRANKTGRSDRTGGA